jgi:hypothetical protein
MRWDSTPFGEENPRAYAFTARAWGNEMGLYAFWRGESLAYAFTARALDKNLDYAFVSLK